MYPVSEEYIRKMEEPDAVRELIGTVGDVNFTSADIVARSFCLSKQCSESGKIKLGSVFTAMLECTFRNGLIERETWRGLQIVLSEGIHIDDNESVEYVPLGVFYVDEAVHTEKGVAVTAYDIMLHFEKAFSTNTLYGTPYDIAYFACHECGVELETTQAEISALPNGNEELWLYANNDIETWRDLLFWIGQSCAGFWTINRVGRLELRSFGMTVNNTITSNSRRKDTSFSDFVTGYTGVSYTKADTKEIMVYSMPINDKLTYDLGENPFFQYGADSVKERMCRNILDALGTVEYVPFSSRVLHGAPYDLGDVIHFTGGRADNNKVSCIMYIEYDGRGYRIEGYGSDPAVTGARSKTDKELQAISKSISEKETIFYEFTNSTGIHIGDGESVAVSDFRFAALTKTKVVFTLEALVNVETTVLENNYYDANLTVTYIFNETELTDYKPKETWIDGNHILHLQYVFDVNSNIMQKLVVMLSMSGGSIDIGMGHVKSTVQGQGLAASDSWDGTFDIRQAIGRISLSHPTHAITIREIVDGVSVASQVPEPITVSQVIGRITLGKVADSIIMRGITETVSVGATEV